MNDRVNQLALSDRQSDFKSTAIRTGLSEPQKTAVILDDPPRDRKSQTHPGMLRREKWIEYMRLRFLEFIPGPVSWTEIETTEFLVLGRHQPKGPYGCAGQRPLLRSRS